MTKQSNKEYIDEMRQHYRAASKTEQTRLLDEIMSVCRWNRKYLIRVLNKHPAPRYPTALYGGVQKHSGRPTVYHTPDILGFLICVWHASNQACLKRLEHWVLVLLSVLADLLSRVAVSVPCGGSS